MFALYGDLWCILYREKRDLERVRERAQKNSPEKMGFPDWLEDGVLAQSHAAVSARPREHCAVLLCAAAQGLGGTLGALPLKPRQEPEVPAPPGLGSEPCGVFGSAPVRSET